jgi:hypothetical protein
MCTHFVCLRLVRPSIEITTVGNINQSRIAAPPDIRRRHKKEPDPPLCDATISGLFKRYGGVMGVPKIWLASACVRVWNGTSTQSGKHQRVTRLFRSTVFRIGKLR